MPSVLYKWDRCQKVKIENFVQMTVCAETCRFTNVSSDPELAECPV